MTKIKTQYFIKMFNIYHENFCLLFTNLTSHANEFYNVILCILELNTYHKTSKVKLKVHL